MSKAELQSKLTELATEFAALYTGEGKFEGATIEECRIFRACLIIKNAKADARKAIRLAIREESEAED